MTKEMDFYIYLIEHYAFYKKISAKKVLKTLDKLNLTDYIYNMYEMYHKEAIENAYDDIDRIIEEKMNK
ncbi:MAG: DUF3791 domain-containing protein [Clostridia bacterium]|nr:DUF3791 domain-containing protein [Clostridia bacterium]